MKNSIKKYLVIAFVVMAVVLTTVFAVSAATAVTIKCSCGKEASKVIGQATCEADAYDMYFCTNCNKELFREEIVGSALGHNLTEEVYNCSSDNSYYTLDLTCTRDKCNYYETDGEVVDKVTIPYKYYKVTFVNPCVTAKALSSCAYATIADTYLDGDVNGIYKEEVLETRYIKEGNGVVFESTYRNDDKKFGNYTLAGWTTDKAYATPGAYEKSLVAGNYSTEVKVPVDGKAQAEFTVYALFAPNKTLSHAVAFYDDTGFELRDYRYYVAHGDTLAARDAEIYKPGKADNDGERYEFSHWVWQADGKTEIKLSDPVYDDIDLKAKFTSKAKEYRLKYFYRDGKTPVEFTIERVVTDTFTIKVGEVEDIVTVVADEKGQKLKPVCGLYLNELEFIPDNSENAAANNAVYNALFKYSERDYDYLFTGEWIVYGTGEVFNLNNMTFNNVLDTKQTMNADGTGYIKLIPKYKRVTRLYPIDVLIMYDNDYAPHPTEVKVQLADANGEFQAGATYTAESYYNIVKDDKGKILYYKDTFYVPYSSSYVVSATSTGYSGKATPNFNGAGFPGVEITLKLNEAEPCSCLCHSILKPIWIKILNLIYNLFGTKVVCCDDMYANIGHQLAYTPFD